MRQANLPLSVRKPLPSVKLLHGDCLEIMPTLPKNSVQMVFADLPYGITSCGWDTPIDLIALWKCIRDVSLSPHTTLLTATFQFASSLFLSNTAHFRYDLIWLKKRATGFFRAKKAPLPHHEHVLLFSSAHGVYNAIMSPGKTNNTTTKTQRGEIFNTKHEHLPPRISSSRYPQSSIVVNEDDLRNDTLNGRKPTRVHPTQKPVALLEWLIRTYTNEGDTVLDPTAGSMTTAVAALRTGRNCICIEKDAEYFRIGSERVAKEQERLRNEAS